MKKRILISLLASVCAVALTVPSTSVFAATAVNPVKVTYLSQYDTMSGTNIYLFTKEEKLKFPNGTYWAGGNPDSYITVPCSNHTNDNKFYPEERLVARINYNLNMIFGYDVPTYYTNSLNGSSSYYNDYSTQCYGFAEKLQSDFFKTKSSVQVPLKRDANNNIVYADGTKYEPRVGDHIRFNDGLYGHSIFVTAVSENKIIYADCNSDGHCMIKWNQTAYLDNLNVNGHTRVDFVGRPMMLGDVTGNTIIDQDDADELSKIIVGNPTIEKCMLYYRNAACDIDGNGKIDVYDKMLLKNAIINKTTDSFGYLYE